MPQDTQQRTKVGCPCGCLDRHDCVTQSPPHIAQKCPHDCMSWGLDRIRYYARELGHCPCVDDNLKPVQAAS